MSEAAIPVAHQSPRFVPDSPLVDAVVPAANREPRRGGVRPSILLLHYTGMESAERAVYWLSVPQSRVSCHYVIDEDGHITQMVPEAERAWHAGVSIWQGEIDINSASVGIEIHNPGHGLGYPDFPKRQIDAVIALGRGIVARHGMDEACVLAHSDVAPARKADPGEKFPWARLAASGLGVWVPPAPVDAADVGLDVGESADVVASSRAMLSELGFHAGRGLGVVDDDLARIVTAFQRRYRPARVDGRLDRSTIATLERLLVRLGRPTTTTIV